MQRFKTTYAPAGRRAQALPHHFEPITTVTAL
jgi:hypothetical protein